MSGRQRTLQRLSRHREFMSSLSKRCWREKIETANQYEILFIVEAATNILDNKVPVTRAERACFMRNLHLLHQLSRIRDSDQARTLLLQKGSRFLPSLAQAVVVLSGHASSARDQIPSRSTANGRGRHFATDIDPPETDRLIRRSDVETF